MKRTVTMLSAVAAAVALAACGDREADDRTAGQQLDSVIAQADRQTDRMEQQAERGAERARDAAGDAADATSRGVDRAGDAISDAAITASVNAELARDSQLSALGIDVDTDNGRVTLTGRAPDEASRERATQLASSVRGVVSVDNNLQVESGAQSRTTQ
ncbi:MAG TPA: BON domain-containing protein [Burkholderiaceae bacterium]|nr:BON domain-containing protein [Burkholderiaceae bacterium]